MSDILFKTPIYIGGKEVILVNDIAGTPSTDSSAQHSYISVSRADKETPSLFVFEDDIISLRAEFPTLPIFGIWQLVFNNGLIDWSVNHYWIEASVASGPVISRNTEIPYIDKAISADNMVGGFCSSLACVPSTDVVKIDVNFDLLTLPDDYILTNEEVRVERKKHLKKANIQSLFTFVAIIGTTSFLSFYSVYKNNMDVDNVAAIKQTLVAAVAEVNSYKITRYPKIKSYDEKLLRLGTLYLFDKGLSTPNYVEGKENYQGLSGKYFDILTSKEVITDPSLRWDWVTTEKTPIGRWLVRFK